MLLRDIYEQNHYAFVKTPMTWEESIRECCKPLEADGIQSMQTILSSA